MFRRIWQYFYNLWDAVLFAIASVLLAVGLLAAAVLIFFLAVLGIAGFAVVVVLMFISWGIWGRSVAKQINEVTEKT